MCTRVACGARACVRACVRACGVCICTESVSVYEYKCACLRSRMIRYMEFVDYHETYHLLDSLRSTPKVTNPCASSTNSSLICFIMCTFGTHLGAILYRRRNIHVRILWRKRKDLIVTKRGTERFCAI